jgi:hypothetical protein
MIGMIRMVMNENMDMSMNMSMIGMMTIITKTLTLLP